MTPKSAFYLNAYNQLSTDKSIGFAEGPIPWTAIDRFAQRHGIEGEGFEELVFMVRAAEDEDARIRVEVAPGDSTRDGCNGADGSIH